MKQAANLNFELGVYLPGTKIKTSPTDFAPLEQLQMMKFKGESWQLFGPLIWARRTRKARPSLSFVILGWCLSTRPGISRFRVRC